MSRDHALYAPSRFTQWSSRLIATLCIIGALYTLGLGAHTYLSRKIERELTDKLKRAHVKGHWARLEIGLREVCAERARFESLDRAWSGEVGRLCAPIALSFSAPRVQVKRVDATKVKVWLRTIPNVNQRDDRNQSGRVPDEDLERGVERLVTRVSSRWSSLWRALSRLGDRTVELRDLSVYLSRRRERQRPLLSRGSLTVSARSGVLMIPSAQVGGLLGGAHIDRDVQVAFTPQEVSLLGEARLRLTPQVRAALHERGVPQGWTREVELVEPSRVSFAPTLDAQITLRPQLDEPRPSLHLPLSKLFPSVTLTLRRHPSAASRGVGRLSHQEDLWALSLRVPHGAHSRGESISLSASLTSRELSAPRQLLKRLSSQTLQVRLQSVKVSTLSAALQGLNAPSARSLRDFAQLSGELTGTIDFSPRDIKFTSAQHSAKARFALTLDNARVKMRGLPELSLPSTYATGRLLITSRRGDTQARWDQARLTLAPRSHDPAQLSGSLSLSLHPSADKRRGALSKLRDLSLAFDLKKLSCQRAYELIPRALLGPIRGATLTGSFAPKLRLTYRLPPPRPEEPDQSDEAPRAAKPPQDLIKLSLKRFQRRCTFSRLNLRFDEPQSVTRSRRAVELNDVTWLNEPFTFTVSPEWTGGEVTRVGPETREFVPISELPGYLGGAMYLTEETGFWRGGAVSVPLLTRALNTNIRRGDFVYGGSTITQQLVKNLFLHREKTLSRKFREALISARIIDSVSKKRVLELYLNMIEFGPNIFGVQRASRYYFQKDARAISPEEAIFLAMLKVSPKRGARWVKRGSSPTFTWWRKRSVQVFERLVSEGLITEQRARGAAPFVLRWSKQGEYLGYQPLKESL